MITKRKYRAKKFAKAFIETNGNATQSYKVISPLVSNPVASELGHRQLRKVETQREITKLLPKDNEDTAIIKQAYATYKKKEISWSELHAYLETSLKLKGYLKDKQESGTSNIAIIINK